MRDQFARDWIAQCDKHFLGRLVAAVERIEVLEKRLKAYDEMFGVKKVFQGCKTHPFHSVEIDAHAYRGLKTIFPAIYEYYILSKIVEMLEALSIEYFVEPETKGFRKKKEKSK